MSSEIQFQEVVSNSATEGEPLGTLAGRGINVGQKGDLQYKRKEFRVVINAILNGSEHSI